MDAEFWFERWRARQIGFHQPKPNAFLRYNFHRLAVAPGRTVFVPLCGKSLDMLWLAEAGYAVVGVELSVMALQAFFEENRIAFRKRRGATLTVLDGAVRDSPVCLYGGDYFAMEPRHLDGTAAIYDRAALIALPPAMRPQYVAQLGRLLPGPVPQLLITLEYSQHRMDGPPFSVEETEVRRHYAANYRIQILGERDVLEHEPRFQDRLTRLTERAYLMMPV